MRVCSAFEHVYLFMHDLACPDDWFKCENNHCIPMKKRCDNQSDCNDMSDEKDCDNGKTSGLVSKSYSWSNQTPKKYSIDKN